mmetsp:Transcript_24842/g.57054  ORF Transcript_24842/g.57054 Transcript_24842/m.57054 type:complete len:356 (-) Transcript_24842:1122-2189(-)
MSSSRRSLRRTATKSHSSIPDSVRKGLESLIKGNESTVQKMLSARNDENLAEALEGVMRTNDLSAEMLLARFFDASVLSIYCEVVLGKSGKGGTATLAARIASEWIKPSFDPSASLQKKRKNEREDDQHAKKKASTKRDEHDDEDDDWRKHLFFWRGRLKLEKQTSGKLQFEGSWVSGLAAEGMPSQQNFEESKDTNSFHLHSTSAKLKLHDTSGSLIEALVDHQGKFNGEYLLDQGDGSGPKKNSDINHRYSFGAQVQSDKFLMVAASGTTHFGNFVSFGYVQTSRDGDSKEESAQMVLARRYVDETDARHSWWKNPNLILERWDSIRAKKGMEDKTTSPSSSDFWLLGLPRRV